MKKHEILAKVICDLQDYFISKSFYDDDGNRDHSNVSSIREFVELDQDYDSILMGVLEIKVRKEPIKSIQLSKNINPGDEDISTDTYSGTGKLLEYDNFSVKAFLLSRHGSYSYCGPFYLFYKIKGIK